MKWPDIDFDRDYDGDFRVDIWFSHNWQITIYIGFWRIGFAAMIAGRSFFGGT